MIKTCPKGPPESPWQESVPPFKSPAQIIVDGFTRFFNPQPILQTTGSIVVIAASFRTLLRLLPPSNA